MKQLEKTIIWSGDGLVNNPVTLKQIDRRGSVALYERIRQSGKAEGYEVIKIRVRKAALMPSGKWSEDHEVYPSAKDFGPYGKFITTRGRAEEVFNQWVKEQDTP